MSEYQTLTIALTLKKDNEKPGNQGDYRVKKIVL